MKTGGSYCKMYRRLLLKSSGGKEEEGEEEDGTIRDISKGLKMEVNQWTLRRRRRRVLPTLIILIGFVVGGTLGGTQLSDYCVVEKPGPASQPTSSPSSTASYQHHHHHHAHNHNDNSEQRDSSVGSSLQNSGVTDGGGGWLSEEVLCQIRTLHTDLDLENLTVPIVVTEQLGAITKLRLLCNDVLFFESALQGGQLSLFSELQELSIDKCKLKYLPSSSFAGLKHLRRLSIRTGNADWAARSLELAPSVLEDVPQIRHLNLAYNHIWSLPPGLLCQVNLLSSLNLTHNLLSDIDDLGLPGEEKEQRKLLKNSVTCLGEIRAFDLSHNTLRTLGRGRLERLKRLQELRLQYNWLEELHDQAFSGLNQLRQLNLSSNRLVALPPQLFGPTRLLRELDLNNNSITSLSPKLLEPLEHLQVLDVSRNALSTTSGDPFKGLVRLVILNLSRNQISALAPTTFKDLYALQVLDLSFNQISTIEPETFMSMSNLHSLDLSRNQIKSLSAAMFDGLYVLHRLILDYNEINGMESDALKNCTSLQDLGLVGNKLTSVPTAALRTLGLLRTLDLGENRISVLLNSSFNGLGQLYGLRLVDNQISSIPRGLCDPISRLRVLNIGQNRISKVHNNAFTSCPELRVLKLDSNQLKELPNGMAGQLPALLWLNVSENQLKRMEYGTLPQSLELLDVSYNKLEFLGLGRAGKTVLRWVDGSHNQLTLLDQTTVPSSLEVLRLNHNHLKRVSTDTLGRASKLRRVELMGNQLESIPLAALRFPPLPPGQPLPEFLLGGNPFMCDCEMEWLTRINQLAITRSHPTVLDLDSIVCRLAYSRSKTHAPLVEMKSQDFLCPYKSHCFALCHCCEFDACDCAMTCPSNCTCYHDDTWSANVVDCAGSAQPAIPGRLPMDSTEVYLDGNEIRVLKSHTLIGRKNLRVLYLNGSGIEVISNKSFNGLQSLSSLHLEDNSLSRLHGYEFDHLSRLRELYLQNNRIRSISNVTFLPLKSLEILRLDGNSLAIYSVWQLSLNPYLVEIGLARNDWSCDCQFLHQLHSWLHDNSRKIIDYPAVRCVWNTSRTLGPFVSEYNETCGTEWAQIRGIPFGTIQLLPLVAGVALAIVTLLLIVILLVWKEPIRLWMFTRWGIRSFCGCGSSRRGRHVGGGATKMDEEKSYDAYLIYSQKDEGFVTEKIADELETGGESYRLCLHHRDLVNEGGDLKSMMWGAVENCKVIVLLLSRNFWNEWGGGEAQVALSSIILGSGKPRRRRRSIILIQTEDVPTNLPQGVKFNKLLWKENKFWPKLKFLLPPPSCLTSSPATSSSSAPTNYKNATIDKYRQHHQQPLEQVDYDPKLWPYHSPAPAFVALPPKYQSPLPKSPPSNSTDSTTVEEMVGGSSSTSGTSGSSFYSPHIPKSPLPPLKSRAGDSYLTVEGEHVYSSLDPPSPQQPPPHLPSTLPFQQWGIKISPNNYSSNNIVSNFNNKNIHLPNGYTYSPSPKPQPQWHPHPPTSPMQNHHPHQPGGHSLRRSNGKTGNNKSSSGAVGGPGENVQTYLV